MLGYELDCKKCESGLPANNQVMRVTVGFKIKGNR